MGIPGLTSFVNSIENFWTKVELQDTKLVIDGSSLCFYLYVNNGLNCRCGGQYDEFYDAVVSFFDAMSSSRVECFVVFDGTNDPSGKKLDTLKMRMVKNIQTARDLSKSPDSRLFVLPLFAKLVFQQALRDRGVKFAICDSEADTEIASLAAALCCPVLSNDSDFFIFDIKAGYIPLSFLDWKSDRLTASIFDRRKLASHFRIREEFIPLLASLAGNDYVSSDTLAAFDHALSRVQTPNRFSRREARFARIGNFLTGLPSSCTQGEALERSLQMISSRENRDELRQAVELSLQEYNFKQSKLLGYFEGGTICSSLKTQNGQEIEEWVLRQLRAGRFSTRSISNLIGGNCFLRIQVENCQEVSANRCSLFLRQLIYIALNKSGEENEEEEIITTVQEWDREGLTVKLSNLALNVESVVPSVSLIPYLDVDERLKFLSFALDADTIHVHLLPEELKLIAASFRYLLSHAQPAVQMNHLLALLCCWVMLEDNSLEPTGKTAHGVRSSQTFDIHAAHSFCQWQCVLRETVQLNFTLQEPLPTPCIHRTFNGETAHSLHEELRRGRTPEELLPSFKMFRLFHRLYVAVTSDLLDKMTPQAGKGGKETDKDTRRCRVKTKLTTLENRFAFLCDIGEQQNEDDTK